MIMVFIMHMACIMHTSCIMPMDYIIYRDLFNAHVVCCVRTQMS